MISTAQIQELLSFEGGDAPVLSVYLNTTPERQIVRSYKTAFEDLVKQIAPTIGAPQRPAFSAEVERIVELLRTEPPKGLGMAIFACSSRGFWQVLSLPVPVADSLQVGPRPYLRPLFDVLDRYERYLVALVDKEKARLFTVFIGEIEEEKFVTDVVPGKHDQGGWSQANFQRHHEAHVFWHLRHVVNELTARFQVLPFDRLILAGPDEVTGELRRLLPLTLSERVAGTFPAEIFAGTEEILEKTLAIEREARRATEEKLLSDLDDARFTGMGVVGLAPTFQAIRLGAVYRLVVVDGYHLPGAECPNCGLLLPSQPASCPDCGSPMTPLGDVIERAVERTLDEGGLVETVHHSLVGRFVPSGEGIGAFLRFPIETILEALQATTADASLT